MIWTYKRYVDHQCNKDGYFSQLQHTSAHLLKLFNVRFWHRGGGGRGVARGNNGQVKSPKKPSAANGKEENDRSANNEGVSSLQLQLLQMQWNWTFTVG